MKPLQIIVGVQSTSFSPSRIADVAIVAGGEALVVNPPADVADLELELMHVVHSLSIPLVSALFSSVDALLLYSPRR